MQKVTVEKQFSVKVKDWAEGFYDSVALPVLVAILEVVQAGSFDLDWKAIGTIAASALINYILKSYVKPTKVIISQPTEQLVASVKEAELSGREVKDIKTV